ncbi:YbaB/EbfC family DNA-binding protein [Microbacterium protaetiae]|uniref:YbaB/EbfC family DNA-binding protein n=2 Tax=Microbacterium protaetiae TaxID=2509458 RepID=A0A4P6EQF4_9MICO|nr:YbaB/EbfC family DNA-binding protein [Microbacterium protaetiae]
MATQYGIPRPERARHRPRSGRAAFSRATSTATRVWARCPRRPRTTSMRFPSNTPRLGMSERGPRTMNRSREGACSLVSSIGMSDFGADDPDLLIERVRLQVEQAQERARAAQQMRAQVEAVRGKAYSQRRELSVTVDASGRLVDVELSDAALELRARDLSRLIVVTAQEAARDAGAQAMGLAAAAFGDDSPVVSRLRDEVQARTGAEHEE